MTIVNVMFGYRVTWLLPPLPLANAPTALHDDDDNDHDHYDHYHHYDHHDQHGVEYDDNE